VLKQGPSTYFTIGVKFCTQQTIISKNKKEKIVVTWYEKPRLGLGGLQIIDE
jgi:hypothetical protein